MFFTKRQKKQPEFSIHLCIPLSTASEFDTNQIMKEFRDQWGIKIACGENPEWSDSDLKIRKYLLTDGANNLVLSVSEQPLPRELLNLTIESAFHIDEEQRSLLLNHKAYILIDYVMSSQSPIERVRFVAQTLLNLLNDYKALATSMYPHNFINQRTGWNLFLKIPP